MRVAAILTLFATAVGVAACASYNDYDRRYGGAQHDYGRYDYAGGDYDRRGNDCGFFEGSGGALLDPWLACTREGQKLVRDRYDQDEDRRLTEATAEEANIWFRRYADENRDMRLTDPEIKAALVTHVRFTRR